VAAIHDRLARRALAAGGDGGETAGEPA
jgi:hypothetical protein